jgi:hypothetical protein
MQRDVDPKLLAASNRKGPTRRKVPTQKAPKAKINVQNIIFVHVLGVSTSTLSPGAHTLCTEIICVSTASTCVGTSSGQESSFCIPHHRPLAAASPSMRPGKGCQEARYKLSQFIKSS